MAKRGDPSIAAVYSKAQDNNHAHQGLGGSQRSGDSQRHTLDEFLRQFPSVRRDQAIAALELARGSVMTK